MFKATLLTSMGCPPYSSSRRATSLVILMLVGSWSPRHSTTGVWPSSARSAIFMAASRIGIWPLLPLVEK